MTCVKVDFEDGRAVRSERLYRAISGQIAVVELELCLVRDVFIFSMHDLRF